jgi:peptidyl-prolyl cis-trans isomerase B (cyclophilin B)
VIRLRAAALVVLPLLSLAACGSDSDSGTTRSPGSAGDPQGTSCSYPADVTPASKPVKTPPTKTSADTPKTVTISTSAGDIPVTLENDLAPCTVNSFVSLAEQGYYDNTPCHRVSTAAYYILQCGDPDGTGSGGPGYTFADELVTDDPRMQPCQGTGPSAQCTYNTGAVAMANRGPDTNGSQFFLVYGNSMFPPAYTLFGHMDAAGLKVLKAIGAKGVSPEAGAGATDGAPKEPVTITSVK